MTTPKAPKPLPRHGPEPEQVGYGRVSSAQQNAGLQMDALKTAGCERIFTDEGVSGKLASRPELDRCLTYLQPGDVLVVWKLDRLGRSVQHLVTVINDLEGKNVGFRSLTEALDTTTNGGKLVFHIFAAIAEFERGLIVERTMAGLETAKAGGRTGGRPRALTPQQEDAAIKLLAAGETISDVAGSFGCSRAALYRAARRRGITIAAESDGTGGRPPLDPEKQAQILGLLDAGESISATAQATGVARTSVRRAWDAAGRTGPPPGTGKTRSSGGRGGRPRKLSKDQERLAAALIDAGATPTQLGTALGADRKTAQRAAARGAGR